MRKRHMQTHANTRAHAHTHARTCMHTCTHTRTHIQIHLQTHIPLALKHYRKSFFLLFSIFYFSYFLHNFAEILNYITLTKNLLFPNTLYEHWHNGTELCTGFHITVVMQEHVAWVIVWYFSLSSKHPLQCKNNIIG